MHDSFSVSGFAQDGLNATSPGSVERDSKEILSYRPVKKKAEF